MYSSQLSLLGLLLIVVGCIAYYVGEKKAVNSFVGFRIPPTFRDPDVWKAVNTRAGLLFALHGILVTIVGLAFPGVELLAFLLILLLPLIAVITYGTWYAYQLERTSARKTTHVMFGRC